MTVMPDSLVDSRWLYLGLLGLELRFSTANHPLKDGQTERVNALLEEYPGHYVTATQKNWMDLLYNAKFSFNL